MRANNQGIIKKKIIVYIEFGATGHRPIWIKSVVDAFFKWNGNYKLIIWVPQEFLSLHQEWYVSSINEKNSKKVEFRFLEDIFIGKGDIFYGNKFQIIRKIIERDNPDVAFVGNNLDQIIKDIAFNFSWPYKTKIIGIMDRPYLHYKKFPSYSTKRWLTFKKFISAYILNFFVCRRRWVGKILMLDKMAPQYFNKILMTNKYTFLPEYYTPIKVKKNPREFLDLPKDKTILLFIGPTGLRKGILHILDVIEKIYEDEICRLKVSFVIAGLVLPKSKRKIYDTINRLKTEYRDSSIFLFDRLLSDEEFSNFIAASDIVLIPYIKFIGTSGILIHAALIKKRVLASDFGVVGELVKKYKLGLTCDTEDVSDLERGLRKLIKSSENNNDFDREIIKNSEEFLSDNAVSLDKFGEILYKMLIELAKQNR